MLFRGTGLKAPTLEDPAERKAPLKHNPGEGISKTMTLSGTKQGWGMGRSSERSAGNETQECPCLEKNDGHSEVVLISVEV